MKTISPSKEQALSMRRWILIDAADKPVGRVATKAASILRGKHKAQFTPHQDAGDFVIVINASKVRLTGKKGSEKVYYDYSGYPGGLKETPAEVMLDRKPEDVIRRAVKGMLPSGPLGYGLMTKLKIYSTDTHPHAAQQPEQVNLQ